MLLRLRCEHLLETFTSLKSGLIIKAQKDLPLGDLLTILDQDLTENTTDRHLDRLDMTNGLQFSGGGHDFISLSNGQPKNRQARRREQNPNDGSDKKTRLLETIFLTSRLNPS